MEKESKLPYKQLNTEEDRPAKSPVFTKKRVLIATLILIAIATGVSITALVLHFKRGKNNSVVLDEETQALIESLLKSFATIPDKNNNDARVPQSYLSNTQYWEYICSLEDCDLNTSEGYKAMTERILSTYGTNIYDAATWQIALALADKFSDAFAQTNLLKSDHTANGNPYSTLRATSDPNKSPDKTFTYGGEYVTDPKEAYFFRMISAQFENQDPVTGELQSWVDWKPITGENAWAALIGPLQSVFLEANKNAKQISLSHDAISMAHRILPTFQKMQSPIGAIYYTTSNVAPNQGVGQVNPHTVSLENNFSMLGGLRIFLDILKAHQDEIYPDGTSVQADIDMIQQMIQGILSFVKNYGFDRENGYFVQGGLANDPMQSSTFVAWKQPFAVDVQTWGMTVLGQPIIDEWFGDGTAYRIWQLTKEQAGYFGRNSTESLGGVGYSNQPAPVTTPTINVTVTNHNGNTEQQHTIQPIAIFDDGSTQNLSTSIDFNTTREITIPMYSNTTNPLKTIQFIDENYNQVAIVPAIAINNQAEIEVQWNNPIVEITDYAPRHDIQSAEWTLGATNCLKALIAQYEQYSDDAHKQIVEDLKKDLESMENGVKQLRSDQYEQYHSEIPPRALTSLPSNQLAYYYANVRYAIPFGWNSNPLLSTCATAWKVMDNVKFNPFALGGSYQAIDWKDFSSSPHQVSSGNRLSLGPLQFVASGISVVKTWIGGWTTSVANFFTTTSNANGENNHNEINSTVEQPTVTVNTPEFPCCYPDGTTNIESSTGNINHALIRECRLPKPILITPAVSVMDASLSGGISASYSMIYTLLFDYLVAHHYSRFQARLISGAVCGALTVGYVALSLIQTTKVVSGVVVSSGKEALSYMGKMTPEQIVQTNLTSALNAIGISVSPERAAQTSGIIVLLATNLLIAMPTNPQQFVNVVTLLGASLIGSGIGSRAANFISEKCGWKDVQARGFWSGEKAQGDNAINLQNESEKSVIKQ